MSINAIFPHIIIIIHIISTLFKATNIVHFIIFALIMIIYIGNNDDIEVGMKATDTALLGHLQEEGTTFLRCQDNS